MGQTNYVRGFRVSTQRSMLERPLVWKRPRRVFVNSMSDLFHEKVPRRYIEEVFAVMNRATWHQFLVLTKRPERLLEIDSRLVWTSNIWMGVSIENSEVIARLEQLRRCHAANKFLSLEPLLGPLPELDLRGVNWVIVGGESGPKSRRMEPEWVIEIRDICAASKVPFFFKQWGGVQKKATGRVLDGRTWDACPVSARV